MYIVEEIRTLMELVVSASENEEVGCWELEALQNDYFVNYNKRKALETFLGCQIFVCNNVCNDDCNDDALTFKGILINNDEAVFLNIVNGSVLSCLKLDEKGHVWRIQPDKYVLGMAYLISHVKREAVYKDTPAAAAPSIHANKEVVKDKAKQRTPRKLHVFSLNRSCNRCSNNKGVGSSPSYCYWVNQHERRVWIKDHYEFVLVRGHYRNIGKPFKNGEVLIVK